MEYSIFLAFEYQLLTLNLQIINKQLIMDIQEIEADINYNQYTFMEFVINPQFFVKYLQQLKISNQIDQIKNIFYLNSFTLFEWLNKDGLIDCGSIQKAINQKNRTRRMFILLILIGLHTEITYQFFECFPRNKQYIKFYLDSLKINKRQSKQFYEILEEYFNCRFLLQELKVIAKEENLIAYIKPIQQTTTQLLQKLPQYTFISKDFQKQFYKLIFKILVGTKMFQIIFNFVDDFQNILQMDIKNNKNFNFGSRTPLVNKGQDQDVIRLKSKLNGIGKMQIQAKLEQKRNSIQINKFFLKCRKPLDKIMFIQKKMSSIMNSLSQKEVAETKIMIHLMITEQTNFEDNIHLFCNLIALKIIQYAIKYIRGSQNNIDNFIEESILNDFNEILQLGTPKLKNVKWMVIAFTFLSVHFQQTQFQKFSQFIEHILITYKKQASDKNYTTIVLILALIHSKISTEDIESKLIPAWKPLVDNKTLLYQINSYDFLEEIILISYEILKKNQKNKSENQTMIESKLLKQLESMQLFSDFQCLGKSKVINIQKLTNNLQLKQIFDLIKKQQQIIYKIHMPDDKKALLIFSVQIKKLKYYLLTKQFSNFIKNTCSLVTTFSSYNYKKQKSLQNNSTPAVLSYPSVVVELYQNNSTLFMKKLSLAFQQINNIQYSLIALQFCDIELLSFEKLRILLDQNKFCVNQNNIKFLINLKLLKFLLKYYGLKKDQQKVALVMQAINYDHNYQFFTQNKKKKNIFKKLVDFSLFLLDSF